MVKDNAWAILLGFVSLLGGVIYFATMYERESKRANAAEAAVLVLQREVAHSAPTIVEHDARAAKAEREFTSCREGNSALQELWGISNRQTQGALRIARILRGQCSCPANMPQVPE